jgi:hypothetical protein
MYSLENTEAQTFDTSIYKYKMILKNNTIQTKNFKAIYSYSINRYNYSTATPTLPVLVENQTTAVVKTTEVPSIDEIKSRAVKVFENPTTDRKKNIFFP